MSQMSLEKRFGQSAVFVASTLMENGGVPQSATPETLLKEAIHVISCGYEDKTDWGSEVRVTLCLRLFYVSYSQLSYHHFIVSGLTAFRKKSMNQYMAVFFGNLCFVFCSTDRMDLWFCHRRYSYRIQDACSRLEVYILHAQAPGV